MNKIKTYIVNGLNPSINLGPTGITGYKGSLYFLSGSGGQNGIGYNSTFQYGGSAGYVNSGYIDFDYPYSVESINLQTGIGTETSLSINYNSIRPDPTNGTYPVVIKTDKGSVFTYVNTSGEGAPYVPATKDINSLGVSYNQTGYFNGNLNIFNSNTQIYDQRQSLYSGATVFTSSGNICPLYGNEFNNVLGGAGFYGNNGDTGSSYSYSSGNYTGDNYGYGIISLIPNDFILSNHFITGNTGFTGPSDIVFYSLVGGGGGGGGWSSDGSGNARGGGGGGAGDFIHGFLQNENLLNVIIGEGGTGAGEMESGGTGGTTQLNSIKSYGGSGGGYNSIFDIILSQINISGAGGPGYYGGGGGVGGKSDSSNFTYSYGGVSYTNMESYTGKYGVSNSGSDNTAGLGAGSVSTDFGYAPQTIFDDDESGGGGGGGFWGGNGTSDGNIYNTFKDAKGYGCGGGGGSQLFGTGVISGGSGSPGYAIINFINKTHPYLKVYKITTNTTFNSSILDVVKGFWFFLSGNGPSFPFGGGKSYHNTGHFLINEDGVSQINITKIGAYFNIQVIFKTTINNVPQSFNLTSNSPQPYMMILFYI